MLSAQNVLSLPALIFTSASAFFWSPTFAFRESGDTNLFLEIFFKPFVITFWNDAIQEDIYNLLDSVEYRHVIAALNFRVTYYHGCSPTSD
ncbi:hypothetical protein OROMI_018222 [Orobanche minor]